MKQTTRGKPVLNVVEEDIDSGRGGRSVSLKPVFDLTDSLKLIGRFFPYRQQTPQLSLSPRLFPSEGSDVDILAL